MINFNLTPFNSFCVCRSFLQSVAVSPGRSFPPAESERRKWSVSREIGLSHVRQSGQIYAVQQFSVCTTEQVSNNICDSWTNISKFQCDNHLMTHIDRVSTYHASNGRSPKFTKQNHKTTVFFYISHKVACFMFSSKRNFKWYLFALAESKTKIVWCYAPQLSGIFLSFVFV